MPKGVGLLIFGLLTLVAGISSSIRGVGSPCAQVIGYSFTAVIIGAAVVDLFVAWLDARVARHRALCVRVPD
jgi:hypothetical protein